MSFQAKLLPLLILFLNGSKRAESSINFSCSRFMIPKKLRIKNFLSYGDSLQELDFDLFQLAVLTGQNGAGKSSLIEAIPFCIWGEGREKNTEILRTGASNARIEFEFELHNTIYRITRILKATRNGVSQELEFAIRDSVDKTFRALTREGLKDTEAEIEKRIGITYETFTNSAFFAQGKADAFIKNGSIDRRRVLSEILGLNRYEELSKKAKDKADEVKGKIESTRARIELLKSDTVSLPLIRKELQAKLAEEHQAQLALQQVESSLLSLEAELRSLQQKEQDLAVLNSEIASLQQRITQTRRAIHQKESEISAIESRLQKRDTILEQLRQSESLKKEVEHLDQLRAHAQTLKERISERELNYKTAVARLESEKKSAQAQLAYLRQTIAERQSQLDRKPDLLHSYNQLQTNITAFKAEVARLSELDSTLNHIKTKISDLKSEINSAHSQMKTIEEKGKTFKALGDTCPTCLSPINDSHKEHILSAYRADYRAFQAQKDKSEATLQTLQQECLQCQTQYDMLKRKERDLNDLIQKSTRLSVELQNLEPIERELRRVQSDIAIHEAKLKEAEQALAELTSLEAEINALRTEFSTLGYDANLHQQKKSQLRSYDGLPQQLAALEHDEARKATLIQELAEHQSELASLEHQLTAKQQSLATLRDALSIKTHIEHQQQTLLESKKQREAELRNASSQRLALEGSIKEKEDKASLLKTLEAEIAPQKEEFELYKLLQEAYSVKGIQEMLIEKAIPEIERLANELLAQLTNNLFSLSIKTEGQTKKGNATQTLDIIISDANGNTRPYETFSGGERFRIDFSLRLALSKYLATASGTPIKMLIIDEGFGTQDETGIDAMVEAINHVSDDFEKLIVITHLDEMKDAFPTRIVVEKDPLKGSRFEVIS
jgi:exonuclease SbcC